MSFGGSFAVALSHAQEVFLWGKTPEPLDIGCTVLPNRVEALQQTKVAQAECGRYHIAVLTAVGQVLTWGCGVHGQLGLGDKSDRNVPWVVPSLANRRDRKSVV